MIFHETNHCKTDYGSHGTDSGTADDFQFPFRSVLTVSQGNMIFLCMYVPLAAAGFVLRYSF